MSLESPITYAEFYWKYQVDATKAFADDTEKASAPFAAAIINELIDFEQLPTSVATLLSELQAPHSAWVAPVLGRFASEVADSSLGSALGPMLRDIGYAAERFKQSKLMTAAQAALLNQRNRIEDYEWDYWLTSEGFDETMQRHVLEASLPYPALPDIIRWARYLGDYDDPEGAVISRHYVDERDYDLWEWLSRLQLNTVQVQSLFKRGLLDEPDFYSEIGQLGWHQTNRANIRELAYNLPNAMLLIQGGLVQGIRPDDILANISKADIHPDYAQTYLDAVLIKPASEDIIAYQLRQDPDLSILEAELRKVGVHPAYTSIYKELAYQIPPVADIITMAVREAFTPAIAERFGQYEDFPDDLEKYAGMKGLSKEWAERYWAAHWALPSPQQGFQMLHRGVIQEDELDMLLRAQDVMPFWRDKLTQIAYRPLTRVDVRRMYKEGVLNERQVYESYLDQGYSDENAERMALFTVRQTLSSLAKFTTTDIIKAYSTRMISESIALSLLDSIGISRQDARYIVSTAEYKRVWAFTDDKIAGIRNLYKKRVYDENQTRDKLARLNLPADQINVLLEQWLYEKIEELDGTWTTAQTLKFLKRKLITAERAKREFELNGYDEEHATIYIKDSQWIPPPKSPTA